MVGLGLPELIILLIVGILVFSRAGRGGTLAGRLDRLERKVDLILDHLGIDPARLLPPGVAELIAQGRKIEAIKLYRERTGAGLAEAKTAVERFPQKPASPAPDEV
jgi:Ribosomal protein L7/L12 C-terminal domain